MSVRLMNVRVYLWAQGSKSVCDATEVSTAHLSSSEDPYNAKPYFLRDPARSRHSPLMEGASYDQVPTSTYGVCCSVSARKWVVTPNAMPSS
ncbi:hypothetical protein NEUTE1DRAFT_101982 [Neurospora tetrasperma FGSC 2508]|uniref:Uncharacterized protein n=1 Tax=Neurospora tetrasperma (strain FGSC 2508 / ATCC MYA-4615 / P0657) TaxID=510951 RepID=F8MQT1_NEUT8|nr:uncharacterized protein NEUTE1DRAFT_101982 [Neurospora tetrasperma FGSC 2508]EGO56711.1 hypothetical protein NEUTE1DRAFT_101982 [Neurospora tetrasperma FGSC 2508]